MTFRTTRGRLGVWRVGLALPVLLPMLLTGCERPPDDVVLGVATSDRFVDAARLAFEDAAAAGLMAGVDTVLVPEGTNEAAPAIRAAQRLVARAGLIGVVGHSNSSASLAAAGIYNEAGVTQVAPTSSAVVYSQAGPYSFRLVPPDDQQAGYLVDQVADALPRGGRIALFYVNDDYGRGLRNAVRPGLTDGSREVVLEFPYLERSVEASDVAQAGDGITTAAPDLILWLGRGSTLDHYLPTLRSSAPGAVILGADGVSSVGSGEMNGGSWTGVRHVDFLDMAGTLSLREFAERYEARFERQATVADALTYDATRLLVEGIAAGARTGGSLRDHLATLGRSRPAYEGITGPITFDEDGNISRGYVMVRRQ